MDGTDLQVGVVWTDTGHGATRIVLLCTNFRRSLRIVRVQIPVGDPLVELDDAQPRLKLADRAPQLLS